MKWYIVTPVLSTEVQKGRIAKLQTEQTVAVSPPIPPPQGDQIYQGMSWQHLHQPCVAGKVYTLSLSLSLPLPGNDVPWHATRQVATQQPDKALHFTSSLACAWTRTL